MDKLLILTTLLLKGILSQEQSTNCTSGGIPFNACQLSPIVFISGVTVNENNCDGSFPSTGFITAPRILFDTAEEGAYYTFAFIGPGPFLNWLVVNIPDCAFLNGTLTSFPQVAYYIPPLTLFGVDFIFDALVYKQSQKLSDEEFGGGQRVFFNMGDFASTNSLCGPIGGLQMRIYFSVVVK
ncbi:uncharacterized protein [Halyomorpha halys]|uniref:uncharacterized protein n=1 Tax=Halyomorpha halys TaxID=286706 RepID=UPI0006D4F678|nr:uncharacterized protein LOC106686661 [Halyomorpha halys]